MKSRIGRLSGAIARTVLREFVAAVDANARFKVSETPRCADDRDRRVRRAEYAAEALREQQEEGRRAREAYRRAQQSAGRRAGEGGRRAGEGGGPGPGPGGRGSGPDSGPGAGTDSGAAGGPRTGGSRAQTRRYRGRTVPDYYEVLEVSPRARQAVIEKAYRALMREDHPDQGGDPRKAQLINEAYDVVGDQAKRREYDRENGLV